MNFIEYNLVDFILVDYVSAGESINQLRILRSRSPRRVGARRSGQSVIEWINENEDLCSRIVFQDEIWNVKEWESTLYTSEISDYGVKMEDVVKISRVINYELPATTFR